MRRMLASAASSRCGEVRTTEPAGRSPQGVRMVATHECAIRPDRVHQMSQRAIIEDDVCRLSIKPSIAHRRETAPDLRRHRSGAGFFSGSRQIHARSHGACKRTDGVAERSRGGCPTFDLVDGSLSAQSAWPDRPGMGCQVCSGTPADQGGGDRDGGCRGRCDGVGQLQGREMV